MNRMLRIFIRDNDPIEIEIDRGLIRRSYYPTYCSLKRIDKLVENKPIYFSELRQRRLNGFVYQWIDFRREA